MDVQTEPVYTAAEFSELTGMPVAAALEAAGHPPPGRRVFSWTDALRKLAEEFHSSPSASGNGYNPSAPSPRALREAERILRRGGRAFLDLNESLRHISVDPKRLSGSPEIRGTRVHAFFVGMEAKLPGGRNTLMQGYDLNQEEIDDAVAWRDQALTYAA